MSTENKDRLALRMKPDTKRKIDQWYKAAVAAGTSSWSGP